MNEPEPNPELIHIACAGCGQVLGLSTRDISRLAGLVRNSNRTRVGGAHRKMKACKHCQEEFTARQIQWHEPNCPKRQTPKPKARQIIMRECPYCHGSFSTSDLQSHSADCAKEYRSFMLTGRPEAMRPCKYCGESYAARDMIYHTPRCALMKSLRENGVILVINDENTNQKPG